MGTVLCDAAQTRRWCVALLVPLVLQLAGAPVPPECPPTAVGCEPSKIQGVLSGNYYSLVSDRPVQIHYVSGDYFSISCNNLALDNPELSRYSASVDINLVTIKDCAPPSAGSFAAAIATHDATSFSELNIEISSKAALITHTHLTGLEQLRKLSISGINDTSLAPGALAALSATHALQTLVLDKVRTPAADLARLPPSLQELNMSHIDATSINIESLLNLTKLYVKETRPITMNLSNAAALRILDINAPNTVMPEDALPRSLTALTQVEWNETQPMPKTRCAQLNTLDLTGTNDEAYPLSLPDGWLSNCGQLRFLSIKRVPISGVLSKRVLANATALYSIEISQCNLTAVEPGIFDNVPHLSILDLSNNKLTCLPRGLFDHTKSLKKLVLAHNQLTSDVAWTITSITSLTQLWLDFNPRIGDLCSPDLQAVPSPLNSLMRLRRLDLKGTGVTRICSDWRENLTEFYHLDLSENSITLRSHRDLQFRRNSNKAEVRLGHFKVHFTREDFYALTSSENTTPSINIYGSLKCDCTSYWYVLALRNKTVNESEITICDVKPVTAVHPDTLTCLAPTQCATLPKTCTCHLRNNILFDQIVTVKCHGLIDFPRLPPAAHKWILDLANNNISQIAAVDVSQDIMELDLRNNLIKKVDFETAVKLASVSLQLANNPLECHCEALKMLAPLLDPHSKMLDKNDLKCNNNTQITLTTLNLCPKVSYTLLSSAIFLPLTVLAVGGLMMHPTVRWHIRMILMRLGWAQRFLGPADDDRPYDAFVSFAHEDEELVVEQLVARLESGLHPYRLCLHHRDWAPGEWIPAQIAASVRASRRTVAVVSRHYLQSGWSRVEFREATAASLREGMPRLVVVLLDKPERLTIDMDSELQAYVRNNTYVCWRDPWFWEKLKQALPPPRERRPPVSAPLPVSSLDIHPTCSTPKIDPPPTASPASPHRKADNPAPSANAPFEHKIQCSGS